MIMSTAAASMEARAWTARETLPGASYVSEVVFALEKERIFARAWTCVGRAEEAPGKGDFFVRDLLGESLILVRGSDDRFRAYHNVCRHRGTRLCDGSGRLGARLTCPYHAWTYRLDDGALVGTPNVGREESLDRAGLSLLGVRCEEWEGFLFVNLRDNGRSLLETLQHDPERPTQFARFRMGALRTSHWSETGIAANWKIYVENYHECLHCPVVHPELVRIVPTYRRGSAGDDDSWGVPLGEGMSSLTRTGRSKLPALPGIEDGDLNQLYGCYVFPNLLLDFSSDCVTWDAILPQTPDTIVARGGYLFDPATIASPDFDPSDVVEFSDLVTQQDIAVCERVQRGMSSSAYAQGGVYPWQDRYVHAFAERYRRAMERDDDPARGV